MREKFEEIHRFVRFSKGNVAFTSRFKAWEIVELAFFKEIIGFFRKTQRKREITQSLYWSDKEKFEKFTVCNDEKLFITRS